MKHLDLTEVRSVLLLGAHSDDIEIGCGGTIQRLLEEHPGLAVTWVVLSATGERVAEAEAGAGRLLVGAGPTRVVTEHFSDSYFPAEYAELKTFLHDLASEIKPDVVFTHRLEDRHQDHRLVAELTWNVFRDLLILEYEIPKYEGDLGHPNVYIPLTWDQADRKVDTLVEAFPSQSLSADTMWALLRLRGAEARANEGLAEGFTGRKLVI